MSESSSSSGSDGRAVIEESALLRLLGDDQSSLVQTLYQRYVNHTSDLERAEKETKVGVRVPFFLRSEDLATLRDTFPTLSLVTVNLPTASPVLMKAYSYVATEMFAHIDSWPGERVVYLNGSVLSAALRSRSYVHSCVDITDSVKHEEFLSDLHAMNKMHSGTGRRKVGLVDEYCARGSNSCDYFCTKPVECTRRAESVWVDHCETNIGPVQLAHVMLRHRATRAFGLLVYDVDMLEGTHGFLPELNAEWLADEERDELVVVSLQDSEVVWRHSLRAWRQIVTEATLNTGGFQFIWEVVAQHGAFMYYRMVKVVEQPEAETVLMYRRWDRGGVPMVRLTNWRLKPGCPPYLKSSWYAEPVDWPVDLYEKMAKKAAAAPQVDFTVENLRRFLRDYNSTCVVGGTTVSSAKYRVYGKTADEGIQVIYVAAYKQRYEAGKSVEEMRRVLGEYAVLAEKGMIDLAWLLAAETWRTGRKVLWDKFTFSRADFDLTPSVEYLSRSRVYTTVIPKEGTAPVSLRREKSVVNSGFYFPEVSMSASELLAQLRGSKPVVVEKGKKVQAVSLAPRFLSPVKPVVAVSVPVVECEVKSTVETRLSEKLLRSFDLTVGRGRDATKYEYEEDFVEEGQPVVGVAVASDVQDVMDELLGWGVVHPVSARSNIMHISDQEISVTAVHNALNVAKMELPANKRVYESVIRAPVEDDRPQTGLETAIAFNKRNNDAPRLRDPTDHVAVAQEMWDHCCRGGFFADDADELLSYWNSSQGMVRLNEQDSDYWISRASAETITRLLNEDVTAIADVSANLYELMVKAQVKPKLDSSAEHEYSALQTVVYHKKQVNALFSPVYTAIAQRLCRLFNPKIVLQMRKSGKEMQDAVRHLVREAGGASGLRFFEADIARYDKSQDQVAAELERLVYAKLGLDPMLLEVWMNAAEYGEICSSSAGFRAFVAYQRKSGTATTTLGNTLLNVFSVVKAFDWNISDVVFGVFLGDDSLIAYRGNRRDMVDGQEYMSAVVNLRVKSYDTEQGYICSQYVVPDGHDNLVLMSDPVKRMACLGRSVKYRNGENFDQVLHEKWVSLVDQLANYDSATYRENLDIQVQQRLGCGSILRGIEALSCLRNDEKKYRLLWNRDPVSVLC